MITLGSGLLLGSLESVGMILSVPNVSWLLVARQIKDPSFGAV